MISPPTFASIQEYRSRLYDTSFWRPYVADVLEQHDLSAIDQELVAGIGGTYPTFICGDVVVKMFGYSKSWSESHRAERAALSLLATDPEIAAPRLLAHGQLFEDAIVPWPYLVISRIPGVAWGFSDLSPEEKSSVAAGLGEQTRRVHALRPSGVATPESWSSPSLTAAAERSSLPPHLTAQIDDYVAQLGPLDRVFVHGDMMFRHVFVENGCLTGIIDWGDAMVTDRHYEFAKMHLDLFNCDKALLKVFLAASDWPMTKDFARKAMGHALYRQAHGLAQHNSMDVFYTLPALLPLQDIETLDELANELFAV
jgi:aminoglycoside phosphotransferase (APT) family kinase protein